MYTSRRTFDDLLRLMRRTAEFDAVDDRAVVADVGDVDSVTRLAAAQRYRLHRFWRSLCHTPHHSRRNTFLFNAGTHSVEQIPTTGQINSHYADPATQIQIRQNTVPPQKLRHLNILQ